MSRGKTLALCLFVLAALGCADYLTLVGTEMAETTFDSGIFLRCAEGSPLDASFYTAVRPPTVPFFYMLVDGDAQSIGILQSALSVISWFSLGLALACLFQPGALRAVILIGTCVFSLSSPVNQWDGVIMSESIFLSLLVGSISTTIFAVRAMLLTGRIPLVTGILWFLVSLLFVGSRDSAVYFLVVPWVSALVWCVIQSRRPRDEDQPAFPMKSFAKALLVGFALIVASQVSLQNSKRWQTPLINVILNRVLPDAELYEQWIELYDLPRDPLLEGQANKFAWNRVGDDQQLRILIKPGNRLAEFGGWLKRRGMRSYQRHLVIDEPVRSIREAVNGLNQGLNPVPPIAAGVRESSYSKGAGITEWTLALTKFTYVALPAPLWTCVVAAGLALLCFFRRPAFRAPAVFVLVLLGGAAVQAFVTWHGDVAEVPRHTLVVGILVRVGLGVLAVMLLAALKKRD